MKLKVGDTVMVIAGAEKGKTGEILKIDYKKNRAFVANVNMVTKHVKPSQTDPDGGIITKEASIHISNLAYYDTKAKETVKIGYRGTGRDKVRINKKTGAELSSKKKK
ncbi:MAG: 50S ribosomal protein L24 [bacterium]